MIISIMRRIFFMVLSSLPAYYNLLYSKMAKSSITFISQICLDIKREPDCSVLAKTKVGSDPFLVVFFICGKYNENRNGG